MRRDSHDDVTAVARRRLELLGRELAAAGLGPEERDEPAEPGPAGPVLVSDPGRHARGRARPGVDRLLGSLEDRLPGPLRGRIALRTAHVACLAVLLSAAVAVTAWTTLRSAPSSVPVPMAHTSRAPTPSAAPAEAGALSTPAATGSAVMVDVTGKVRHPGVTTLPAGSRVIDALRKAGGARKGVDLSSLNLARVLLDGEQILVGGGAVSAPRDSSSGAAGSAGAGVPVSLNSAGLDQLDTLPGVGPVTAQKIIDWRTANGSFSSIDELLEVDGIGSKTLADISPHVTL